MKIDSQNVQRPTNSRSGDISWTTTEHSYSSRTGRAKHKQLTALTSPDCLGVNGPLKRPFTPFFTIANIHPSPSQLPFKTDKLTWLQSVLDANHKLGRFFFQNYFLMNLKSNYK